MACARTCTRPTYVLVFATRLLFVGVVGFVNAVFFAHPFYYLLAFLSPSPTYLRSGITKQTLLPPPCYGMRLRFYPWNIPAISSLPCRLASNLCLPTLLGTLSILIRLFFCFCG